MDAVKRKRNRDMADAMDTSETRPGKRDCAADDAMDDLDNLAATQGTRRRGGDLHSAFSRRKEIVKEQY